MPDVYRVAVEADLPALVDLAGQRRQQYEPFPPVFFRPATDARETHAHYLRGLLTENNVIARACPRTRG